ncbi:MAG: lipopolysaccharide heptosyltransferase II, partial [Thermodesulfovibrionales bacterium]
DAALITFLAVIKERAGYKRDGRSFLLTRAVKVPKKDINRHQIYYYLNLLENLGLKAEYTNPYIYISLDERLSARNLLKGLKRPIMGINPGAEYGSAKRWFPERFAEVAGWFVKDTNGSVVIFGSKKEEDIAHRIEYLVNKQDSERRSLVNTHQSVMKENEQYAMPDDKSLLSLSGKTSLRELISLISECDVFVTNDSGPLHISYAVGTPLVAIFGSTDPELTGPPSNIVSNVVINHKFSCSPCFERTCRNSDLRCMYAITSDDVYYGVKRVLPDRPAVFLDRDGTLCKDSGYLSKYEDLQIYPGVENLPKLKEKGFKLIGLTNQSGIARGIIKEEFVKDINRIFIERFRFDGFYYCPHHPDEKCSCRKPELGMALRARTEHRIDFKKSYVIGDKESDMLLAKAMGAKGIFVETGHDKESPSADYKAKDLKEAINCILKAYNGTDKKS